MSRFPMPMPHGWFHVAYSHELKVGESRAIRYFGQELVIFRTHSGEVKVLDAYCPHLGAHLGHGIHEHVGGGGEVRDETIVCPFHGWRFDGNGMCVEVPYAKNIPPKVANKQCLKSWPAKECNHTIFVWYHPNNEPPGYDLIQIAELDHTNPVSEEWGGFDTYRWIIKGHMQEIAENGADPVHFKYVHGTATLPDTELAFDGHRRHGIFRAKMTTPRGDINGCIDSYSNGPGQGWVRYTGICETLQLGHVTPIDNDSCEVNFAFIQKKRDGKVPTGGVNAAIVADIRKQLSEDMPIWEHKIYRPLPVLCDGDGPIAKFRKWYTQFYDGYEEKVGNA